MKKYLLVLFLSIFAIVNMNAFCFAVPANPNVIEVKQPDGKKIKIRNKGDEFYGWIEDKDGYTIIKDTTTEFWTYAQKDSNRKLRPSKNIVGKTKPFSLGIEKNLKDDDKFNEARQKRKLFNDNLKKKFDNIYANSSKQSKSSLFLSVRQIGPISQIKDKRTNFVLLIQFKNLKFVDNPPFTSYTDGEDNDKIRQIFWNLFNEENYKAYGAVGSVKDYFKEVSYGNIEYDSVISPIITLNFNDETKNNYEYYSYSKGAQTSFNRTREMVKQALKQLEDSGYNFKDIWPDSNIPEGFTVIHAGGGAENGNWKFIWSHKYEFSSPVIYDNIRFTDYHVEPSARGKYGSDGLVRIGTICHESIHFFGIPDLYNTNEYADGVGLGDFCIMATGSWNGDNGKCPAHPCAWIKYKLGWIEPKIANEGINYIAESESIENDTDRFYIFAPESFNKNRYSIKEYFLMENKQSVGFDKCLPGNKRGLLIYHIDETKDNNDDDTHYMVDIEEADGTSDWTKDHLPKGINSGADSDYFRSDTITVFNDSCLSSPNSKSYSGEISGIDISRISSSGSKMYFYLPEIENFDNFVDNLNSTGLSFVNFAMKYSPAKTIDDLRSFNQYQQNELKQYFTLSASGAKDTNDMGAIYFDYTDNGLVYGISKDKTGVVTYSQANLIIKLNSILTKSQQDIKSVGNISEEKKSPLENISSVIRSDSFTDKRFTGIDALEKTEEYLEDLGCLIPTFNKMDYKTGYDIIEVTKNTSWKKEEYILIKGKNSDYFYGLSNVVIYPNPVRNGVVNFINLPTETTKLFIEIYTITGQFIKSFNLEDVSVTSTGNRKLSWNCKNNSGASLAPGVYIALIKSGSDKKKIKFAIIR